MSRTFEDDYKDLVQMVIAKGKPRKSRVGDTRQMFGTAITVDSLEDGEFPILTGRQMFYKPVIGELTAFLAGAEDLNSFKVFGCNYWDANAAAWAPNLGLETDDHSVGRIYGAQWREWRGPSQKVDQLGELIHNIIHMPFSRRHILTAWNPGELDSMCLPPCHIFSQFNVSAEKTHLDILVYMRSVDLCLGLPSDVVLYAALLIIIANQTNLLPGKITFMLGDTHVYENHIEVWDRYMEAGTHRLPMWRLDPTTTIDAFIPEHFTLLGYQHEPKLKFDLNV